MTKMNTHPIQDIIKLIKDSKDINFFFLEDQYTDNKTIAMNYKSIMIWTPTDKYNIMINKRRDNQQSIIVWVEHTHWTDRENVFFQKGDITNEISIDNSRLSELLTLIEDKSKRPVYPEWWNYL